ncbi:hypothetical protein [Croceicoccus naphthovorans]|uniref:Uncharacterized protein n=1 Tax=Croceicoccus naphthovorans TaxID=1348774 RepID=A0A0G3XFG3_9SPHN|nr:hypothetical protein [Croceicoccus naphthovorans]AKM09088.1 hypothetical protein AB433_02500 [Croceicoccus naphthovorans]
MDDGLAMCPDRLRLVLWQVGTALAIYCVNIILSVAVALATEDAHASMFLAIGIACGCWLALFRLWDNITGPFSAGKAACLVVAVLVGFDVIFAVAIAA